jgi:teichuronic acid biosynthesis glycosyltransferase TuaC
LALWLAPAYPSPADTIGGTFTQTQARALVRRGMAVLVVAPSPWAPWPIRDLSPRWRRYAGAPRRYRDEGVDVARPRWMAIPGRPEWLAPDRQIGAAARREYRAQVAAGLDISLIHGHFAMPHGVAAVRLGRRVGRPVILTLHGSDVYIRPTTRRHGVEELRSAVLGATGVIAVSCALADRTEELTGRRPTVMPVGIDLAPARAERVGAQEARARLGWAAAAPTVTFIGRLLELKGIRDLATAAAALPSECRVMLVGDGPLRGELAATEVVRTGRVRLVGRVAHEDVPLVLAASDLLVLSSHTEGLGTVLLEAGSMGVPVVGTAVGGVPEVVGEDGGWLCPPRDPAALASSIMAALADPEERRRRAAALQSRVMADYDADVQAGKLIDFYQTLTG